MPKRKYNTNKLISDEDLKKALRLSAGEEGDKQLNDLKNADYGVELSDKEKTFVILYTNPLSKVQNQKYKCVKLSGYTKSMAEHLLNNTRILAAIQKVKETRQLLDLKDVINQIVEREKTIYFADRTKLYETVDVQTKDGDTVSVAVIKNPDDLTPDQRILVSNLVKDRNGHTMYETEKRSEARNFLMNYYKQQQAETKPIEEKTSGVEISLDMIRDKVTAKINVIKQNDIDAAAAGQFIDVQNDPDEEA